MKQHQYLDSEDAASVMMMMIGLASEVFRLKVHTERLERQVSSAGLSSVEVDDEGFDEWVREEAGAFASWLYRPLQPPEASLEPDNARYLWTGTRPRPSRRERTK